VASVHRSLSSARLPTSVCHVVRGGLLNSQFPCLWTPSPQLPLHFTKPAAVGYRGALHDRECILYFMPFQQGRKNRIPGSGVDYKPGEL
jgi:hypothetical protein